MSEFTNWYDGMMDWDTRLSREIPILVDAFGPPGEGRILDAGCGTGRHVCALAAKGYRTVGADLSEDMLVLARKHAGDAGIEAEFVCSPYATLFEKTGGGFDGLFCLANSLPAAATVEAVEGAVEQFARCLRPGGRFVIEMLNYTPMVEEPEAGEDAAAVAGSDDAPADESRGFLLDPSRVRVTGISVITDEDSGDDAFPKGNLYPVTVREFDGWCRDFGLRIDQRWGSVLLEPFDVGISLDMITIGTRV